MLKDDDIQDNETQILPGGGKMSDYQNAVMPHANTTLGVHDDNLHSVKKKFLFCLC